MARRLSECSDQTVLAPHQLVLREAKRVFMLVQFRRCSDCRQRRDGRRLIMAEARLSAEVDRNEDTREILNDRIRLVLRHSPRFGAAKEGFKRIK